MKKDSSEAQLHRLCAALAKSHGAELGRALSKEAVTVGGKIVAFISNGRLVVKLPPERKAELIASGEANPMIMGRREMKEWLSLGPSSDARWTEIAKESARYVTSLAAGGAPRRKR